MSTLKRYNGTDWVPVGPALINADGNMFENIVASKYSPTANYQLNSYVIYNNKFYKCIVPITVAEPWNPNHWEETLVSNELGVMSSEVNLPLEVKISYSSGYSMDQDMDDILLYIESGVPVVITCVDVSTWPGFSSFTNLRNVSISQLHVIRSGSSNDFEIVGDALLSFDETTRKLQILHLGLTILSGITTIYPTVWGMLGAPLATAMDIGKWLKIDANGYPVWAALPLYNGGVE